MNELINWVARNNSLMIQSGFTIVLVLLVVYIYRLFFVNTGSNGKDSKGGDNAQVSELTQKLDQLLQQQKTEPVAKASASGDAVSTDEVERLRTELTTLRAALNESEKKVFEMSPAANAPENILVENTEDVEKVAALNTQVEKLEARLAEYEIISEDIAELGQLRTENAELKKKLNISGEEVAAAAEVNDPTVIPDGVAEGIEYEPLVTPPVSEDRAESLVTEYTGPADEAVEAPPVVQAAPTTVEPFITQLNTEIPDKEKSVLDDFEKLIKRGSS